MSNDLLDKLDAMIEEMEISLAKLQKTVHDINGEKTTAQVYAEKLKKEQDDGNAL